MISGGTPATAYPSNLPRGCTSSSSTRRWLITTAAAAPSEVWDALPAVTLPFTRNTGFSLAKASKLVTVEFQRAAERVQGVVEAALFEEGDGLVVETEGASVVTLQ